MLITKLLLLSATAAEETCKDPVGETLAYVHQFDDYSLTYFEGRGLAEVPRTLFATVGRFPGAGFKDIRLTRDEFNEKKGTGDLAKNLNRVPILSHNGQVIGQSSAIARYLANKFGLLGETASETAEIDSLCEHLVDIKQAFRKLVLYGKEMTAEETAEANKIWFDTPPSPALDGRKERQLQWFLGQVEELLPGDNYSVGSRPSLADAYLFNMLGEYVPELDPKKGEPFGSLEGTNRILGMYPKVKGVIDTFKHSPGMTHFLSIRGKNNF